MKAVILAAGKGKRMGVLTDTCPKPLLIYKGKTLIEHTLSVIPPSCSEIIIVIGYLGQQIIDKIGNKWNGIPVQYVESELKGTGEALWKAKDHLAGEKFLVFPSDDIYASSDIEKVLAHCPMVLASEIAHAKASGGKIEVDSRSKIISITEGEHQSPFLVSTGVYFLNHHIFKYPLVQIPGREEYGLPQTIVVYAKDHDVKVSTAEKWKQIVTAKDLE